MRKVLVFYLIILMSIPALPGAAFGEQEGSDTPKRSQKEMKRQASFKEKVEFLGTGAQIAVTLRGGSADVQYEGEIDEISADSFKLKRKNSSLLVPYMYSQLGSLHLRQVSYKTEGQPDPLQVRRVAYEVGIGKKAEVELTDLKRFSGTIRSFETEAFVINSHGNSQHVKFSDVKRIEKGHMSAAAKITLIAVGIGVAVVVITGIALALSMEN
jgi:ribosome maturation factor RimP